MATEVAPAEVLTPRMICQRIHRETMGPARFARWAAQHVLGTVPQSAVRGLIPVSAPPNRHMRIETVPREGEGEVVINARRPVWSLQKLAEVRFTETDAGKLLRVTAIYDASGNAWVLYNESEIHANPSSVPEE